MKVLGLILGHIYLLQVFVSEVNSCLSMYTCLYIQTHIYNILKIVFVKTREYILIYTMNINILILNLISPVLLIALLQTLNHQITKPWLLFLIITAHAIPVKSGWLDPPGISHTDAPGILDTTLCLLSN